MSGRSNSNKDKFDGGEVHCPYCQSRFKDKEELSKHIDRIHTGSGLLEGDTTKW
jgi:uncharacterized C2H2 Zn-finger protein